MNSSTVTPQNKPISPPPRREQVLIVAHADGWIECFAERHIDVRIVIMPDVNTPESEILAEQYIESSIPEVYRKIYWPGNLRSAGMIEKISPSVLLWRDWELATIKAIGRMGERLNGTVREESIVWTL